MLPSRHWLTSAFITASLLVGAASSQAAIDPKTQSHLPESKRLTNYCDYKNMQDYEGQLQCLQETAGQVNTLVTKFHGQLFSAVGLAQDPKLYLAMLEKWDPQITEQEKRTLRTFHKSCGTELMTAVLMPQEILRHENPYTTAYNLPRYCVDTAIKMSVTYKLPLDFKEASRLQMHVDAIYKYYEQNPDIPLPPRWGQEEEERNDRGDPVPFGTPKWTFTQYLPVMISSPGIA